MFVEHKEATKTTTLSMAIRAGAAVVPEATSYCGCAVGAAYTFMTGRDLDKDQWTAEAHPQLGPCGWYVVAKMFGVPLAVVRKASDNHLSGLWSREQCADYIESKGY
jgi:hypothetical protein